MFPVAACTGLSWWSADSILEDCRWKWGRALPHVAGGLMHLSNNWEILTPSRPMMPLRSLYPGTLGGRDFSQSDGSPCGETGVSNFTAHFMEFPLSLGEGVWKLAGFFSEQGLQHWDSVNKSCNVFVHAGNRKKVSSGFLSISSYQGGKSGLWSFVNNTQSWRQLPPPSSAMQSSGSHKTFMKPVINWPDKEQDIRFQESAASWGRPSL